MEAREESRPAWRDAAITLGAAFVVSRLLVLLAALVAEFVLPLDNPRISWSDAPILRSLTSWDALHYLNIATDGYHAEPVVGPFVDYVFFPLYPILIRVVGVLTLGDLVPAALLISNTATVVGMAAVYLLGLRFLPEETARLGAAYLAIAPGAAAFAMAYSDSLLLALGALCLLAVERRRWVVAAVLFALVTLTRLPGIGLALPIAILLWRARDETPLRWLILLAGPIALTAFYAHIWTVTGDFLANLRGQAIWAQPDLLAPAPVAHEPASAGAATFDVLGLVVLGVVLVYMFTLVYVRTARLPMAYIAFAIEGLFTVFAADKLVSASRFLAVVWPFAYLQASRSTMAWRLGWPAFSAGLFVLFAVLQFSQLMTP